MSDEKDRKHLPMRNTKRPTLITYDAKDPDTKMVPIEQLRPPHGAPNVLIVLIDDAGSAPPAPSAAPARRPTRRGWRQAA